MPRQRVIVSIGEALLCEFPDEIRSGGLALRCAQHATQLGENGIPISRLGQDQAANEILTELKGKGITIDHLQSDPDLPTGRLVVRSAAGSPRRSLSARAAFDNLQWDSDLEDVADYADGVIFGVLGLRSGQSRSIIHRFLGDCSNALRLFDLTNREGEAMDRATFRSSLLLAEAAVVDSASLRALNPSASSEDPRPAMREVIRSNELTLIVHVERHECRETITLHTADQVVPASRAYPEAQHDAAMVALLLGMLSGRSALRAVEIACAVAEHVSRHPDESVPREMLNDTA